MCKFYKFYICAVVGVIIEWRNDLPECRIAVMSVLPNNSLCAILSYFNLLRPPPQTPSSLPFRTFHCYLYIIVLILTTAPFSSDQIFPPDLSICRSPIQTMQSHFSEGCCGFTTRVEGVGGRSFGNIVTYQTTRGHISVNIRNFNDYL